MSKAKPRSSSAVDTEIEIDRQATVVQDRHTSRGIFPTLPLAQLCEKCRGVADNLDDYLLKRGNNPSPTKKLIRHHKDVQALKASAQEGCGLCKQFFNSYTGEREEAWCHKQLGIDSGPGTVRLGSFWTLDLFIPHGIEGTAGEKDRDISWSDVKSTVSEYNIRLAAHEEQGTCWSVAFYIATTTDDAIHAYSPRLRLAGTRYQHNGCVILVQTVAG